MRSNQAWIGGQSVLQLKLRCVAVAIGGAQQRQRELRAWPRLGANDRSLGAQALFAGHGVTIFTRRNLYAIASPRQVGLVFWMSRVEAARGGKLAHRAMHIAVSETLLAPHEGLPRGFDRIVFERPRRAQVWQAFA